MLKKKIWINGTGTVGIRQAEILDSLGFNLILSEFDVRKRDIRTKELLDFYKNHRDIPMYAALGLLLEERIKNFKKIGIKCEGSVDDIPFDDLAFVIDACPRGVEKNNVENIYVPKKIQFILNGGADPKLVDYRFFAGIQGSSLEKNIEDYIKNNAMIVSCNSHCMITALSLLINALGQNKFEEYVRQVNIEVIRRYKDPHKIPLDKRPQFSVLEQKEYHQDEIKHFLPEIYKENFISTNVITVPLEYFHTLSFYIELRDEASKSIDKIIEKYKESLKGYQRCILVNDNKVDQKKAIEVANWLNIPDGDILFPIYIVNKAGNRTINVLALNPQRAIVVPSVADLALLKLEKCKSLSEAMNYTNANAKYKGIAFKDIKEFLEYYLDPKNYKAGKKKNLDFDMVYTFWSKTP